MSAGTRSFRSPRRLGNAVLVLLAVDLVVIVTLAAFRVAELGLIRRAQRGQLVTFEEGLSSDDRIEAASITWIVTFLLTGVVWLVWQHRSHANLRVVHRRDLVYTPGWAVGWWLIPVANLWMPFKTIREVWKASGDEQHWEQLRTWPVLGWWWASWLATGVMSRVAASTFNRAESVDAIAAASRLSLFTEILAIAAAVLAILVVRSIVRRQDGLPTLRQEEEALPLRPDTGDREVAPGP